MFLFPNSYLELSRIRIIWWNNDSSTSSDFISATQVAFHRWNALQTLKISTMLALMLRMNYLAIHSFDLINILNDLPSWVEWATAMFHKCGRGPNPPLLISICDLRVQWNIQLWCVIADCSLFRCHFIMRNFALCFPIPSARINEIHRNTSD